MNKILIIDDDKELCALIKRSVQAENIEADFCNTGKYSLQGTTQGNGLTGGVPPVRFSM